jgi:hypothetical protein
MHAHSPNKPNKFNQTSACQKLMAAVFWDRKEAPMVVFMQRGTTITLDLHCRKLKEWCRAIRNKRRTMLTSDVVLLRDIARRRTVLPLEHCCSISSGSCLTTLLTALISLRATTSCLPTWRTWDHSSLAITGSWWKVSKRGWGHRRETSLTQAYET